MKTSYSFDDILIKPKLSNVISRSHVSLKTKLSDKIKLNIPIISSPMDTVTETNMAIAMSLNGGIGIIHRFQSIDEQVKMVKNVKRHLSYIIEKPYVINKNESIEDLILLNKKLNVSGMMVVDNDNKFVGIVSKKDVQIYKLPQYECVLTLSNSTDSFTDIEGRKIKAEPNSIIILKANGVEHEVTKVTHGERKFLKFIFTETDELA